MKKIILLICIVVSLLTTNVFAKTNPQYNTKINDCSIQSFDYNGEPIIAIRDLENFGFTITWSETENRIYLLHLDNQKTDFFIERKEVDVSAITKMLPTYTSFGNIDTFNINGKGFMYFKDLQKFGSISNYNVKLNAPEQINVDVTDYTEYITGYTTVTLEAAKQWAKNKGASQRFIDVADYYWEYAVYTGLRAEVMYAQAALETGFGHYGGNVLPEQNNWAGIKTQNAVADTTYDHECFATPKDGVRCHFNHMLAYTGGEPIGQPHGRYYSVLNMKWAGSVKKVSELSGKWCPTQNYSDKIIKFLDEMYSI